MPEEINLRENPWKNSAELYYRDIIHIRESIKNFNQEINNKKSETENLLLSYQSTPTESSKITLARNYKDIVFLKNYRDDYVAVNEEKDDSGEVIFKPVSIT